MEGVRALRGARAARAPRGANENELPKVQSAREMAAIVRHEREQGDEKRESEKTKCRPP